MFCGFVGLEFLFFAKISGYKFGNSYSQEISEVAVRRYRCLGELQMNANSPNIEALRQLYHQNLVAKTFFDHAARRERDQSETNVDRILVRLGREGHEFQRREIIDLFRKLEEQGCGQFVEGRRGWPSRFVWSAEMTSVARAASGQLHAVEHIADEEDTVEQLHENDEPEAGVAPVNQSVTEESGTSWYEDEGAGRFHTPLRERNRRRCSSRLWANAFGNHSRKLSICEATRASQSSAAEMKNRGQCLPTW